MLDSRYSCLSRRTFFSSVIRFLAQRLIIFSRLAGIHLSVPDDYEFCIRLVSKCGFFFWRNVEHIKSISECFAALNFHYFLSILRIFV